MYLLYNSYGFAGIYILVMIISGLIAISFFNTLVKENNNILFSFIISLGTMYGVRNVFAARNQIFSFLVFILEANFLIELLEKGKKRYFWFLILLAFVLVAVHDTLYILFFVIAMPYLAEIILQKFKIKLSKNFEYSNLTNQKYLVILLILAIFIGFCTPVFATSYTNLINCMERSKY